MNWIWSELTPAERTEAVYGAIWAFAGCVAFLVFLWREETANAAMGLCTATLGLVFAGMGKTSWLNRRIKALEGEEA